MQLDQLIARLLDTQSASERQRLAQLLSDIKGLAANLFESAPPEHVGVQGDSGIPLSFPVSRTLWAPPMEFASMT